MKRSLSTVLLVLAISGCKSRSAATTAAKESAAPPQFADRAAVLDDLEEQRFDEASKLLASAPDTADVHYLRGKLATMRMDSDVAYRELSKAISMAPDWAEYQYEFGVDVPLLVGGLSTETAQAHFVEAGRALERALVLRPNEPRYLYARAYFLTVAPTNDGGDMKAGQAMFDHLLDVAPDTAWAHRVKFDRAAQSEDWDTVEAEAEKAGTFDAREGARLFLQAAGTRLHQGNLKKTREDLEAASRLDRRSATGFCDAAQALDGGSNPKLADPFWQRCVDLLPDGPRAAEAKARLNL